MTTGDWWVICSSKSAATGETGKLGPWASWPQSSSGGFGSFFRFSLFQVAGCSCALWQGVYKETQASLFGGRGALKMSGSFFSHITELADAVMLVIKGPTNTHTNKFQVHRIKESNSGSKSSHLSLLGGVWSKKLAPIGQKLQNANKPNINPQNSLQLWRDNSNMTGMSAILGALMGSAWSCFEVKFVSSLVPLVFPLYLLRGKIRFWHCIFWIDVPPPSLLILWPGKLKTLKENRPGSSSIQHEQAFLYRKPFSKLAYSLCVHNIWLKLPTYWRRFNSRSSSTLNSPKVLWC